MCRSAAPVCIALASCLLVVNFNAIAAEPSTATPALDALSKFTGLEVTATGSAEIKVPPLQEARAAKPDDN